MNFWKAALLSSYKSTQKPFVMHTWCAGISSLLVSGSALGSEPIVKQPAGTQACSIPALSVRMAPGARVAVGGRSVGIDVPATVGACVGGSVATGATEAPTAEATVAATAIPMDCPPPPTLPTRARPTDKPGNHQ